MPVLFADEFPSVLPKKLPIYTFNNGEWVIHEPGQQQQSDLKPVSLLHLVTWNVDAKERIPNQRIEKIIDHLSGVVFKATEGVIASCCVLLQEVNTAAHSHILCSNWIRDNFRIIPGTTPTELWDNTFGLMVLFSKTLAVSQAFIFNLPSTTQKRQALFIDVHLQLALQNDASGINVCPSPDRTTQANLKTYTLRITNTHLESGGSETDLSIRQRQLRYIASMLNVSDISAYFCCGSMCSVRNEDSEIPASTGFSDAYSGLRFSSFTWGMRLHHLQRGFRAKRLDKILYHITEDLYVECPSRIGFFLPLNEHDMHASDHCGLITKIGVKTKTTKQSKQNKKPRKREKKSLNSNPSK